MSHPNPAFFDTVSKRIKDFGDCTEFTIGRDQNCSLDIASPFISRAQCIIKKHSGSEWALYDQSTYKSTLVNGRQVEGEFKILKDNDKVSFVHYKDVELVFFSSCQVNVSNQLKRKASDIIEDSFCIESSTKSLKSSELCTRTPIPSTSSFKIYNDLAESSKRSLTLFETENKSLREKLRKDEHTIELMKIEIQKLKENLKESELEQEKLVQELAKSQHFTDNHSSDFEPDKLCMLEDGMDMDQDLEIDLGPDFEPCKLEPDTDVDMDSSQNEIMDDCFIENHDDRLDLNGIFEAVDKVYLEKEVEILRQRLEDKDQLLSEAFTDKENFKSKVMEVLEHELLCGVCSEILYEGVTLNCRHTFCKQCITEWKKKKKECPVCRTGIKIEVSPLIVDSFIDKAIEMLGGDYKTKRDELKAERSATVVPAKKPKEKKKGRRNVRGRRSRSAITIASAETSIVHIEIPDNHSIIDLTSPVRGPPIANCLP